MNNCISPGYTDLATPGPAAARQPCCAAEPRMPPRGERLRAGGDCPAVGGGTGRGGRRQENPGAKARPATPTCDARAKALRRLPLCARGATPRQARRVSLCSQDCPTASQGAAGGKDGSRGQKPCEGKKGRSVTPTWCRLGQTLRAAGHSVQYGPAPPSAAGNPLQVEAGRLQVARPGGCSEGREAEATLGQRRRPVPPTGDA